MGAEVALAFAAGAATFAVVSVALTAGNFDGLVPLLVAVCIAAIAAMFRFLGVAYAVPAAVAALFAFDWFYIPPTHPHAFPDAENLANLLAALAVGVLIGELAARAGRRADVSELARSELVYEQAALRRVATLVAEGVAAPRLFEAVAEEAGKLLNVAGARIATYDGEDVVNSAEWSKPGHDPPTFDRVRVDEAPAAAEVRRTGRVVRFDDFERIQGATVFADQPRVTSLLGAPITVEGDQWGLMIVWSQGAALADDAAAHLTQFTELVATAIANAEARREVATLADEQAALRRIATLVAEGVPPPEVFSAVARELGQLLGVDSTHLARYEPDGTVTGVGSWSPQGTNAPVGIRVPLDDTTVTGLVHKSGRPARLDGYGQGSGEVAEIVEGLGIRSSVGAPVTVDGRPWGVLMASSNRPKPLAGGTEVQIAAFTDLLATAISNTEARIETHRLAGEQAALRRVATLVAEAVPPSQLFDAVAAEVGSLLDADLATLFRYENEDTVKMLSIWTADGVSLETPETWRVEELGLSRSTAEDNWPGRVDDWTQFSGPLAQFVRHDAGVTSSVSSPILVEGRLWGALAVHSTQEEPLPVDTELRVGEFTGLVATAISNVQAREDLAASRARIVAAADDERRRVVRDLHDGAQQRLVHTVVTLQMASRALAHESGEGSPLVAEALQHAQEATDELRELAHGILPSVLTRGGLRAGVDALASRMPLPVKIRVPVQRLAPEVEATAYFVVAEALTNVAKHSHADRAAVSAEVENGGLHIEVRDDGIGGANAAGTGLVGLADRVAALAGTLRLESPADGGTLVTADIPVR